MTSLDARLALPIVIANVEGTIRMHPRDLARVFLASAAIPGLCGVPARVHDPAVHSENDSAPAAPALLADQALRDTRFPLSVVVVNIVGVVAAVPSFAG